MMTVFHTPCAYHLNGSVITAKGEIDLIDAVALPDLEEQGWIMGREFRCPVECLFYLVPKTDQELPSFEKSW